MRRTAVRAELRGDAGKQAADEAQEAQQRAAELEFSTCIASLTILRCGGCCFADILKKLSPLPPSLLTVLTLAPQQWQLSLHALQISHAAPGKAAPGTTAEASGHKRCSAGTRAAAAAAALGPRRSAGEQCWT